MTERVVFAMTPLRVLTAGLFNFSLLYLAGLFGLLQTFRGFLPFDVHDPGRWLGLVEEGAGDRVTAGAIVARLTGQPASSAELSSALIAAGKS